MFRWFIIFGILLIVVGLVLKFAPWLIAWFGKLPGDITIHTENYKLYIPITSMIIASIIVTLLINLFKH